MKIKSFDRKEELLEAALDEFLAKSYDEASLNNIIKNAGISKGTFYYHFKDKQALYLSLLQSLVDVKIEFVGSKLKDYSHNEDLNIFENFKLQARFGAELAKEHPKYYLFGMMFLREKGNKIYEVAMDMVGDTSEKYFEEMLDKAIEKGELRAGVSVNFSKKILTYLFSRLSEIFDFKHEKLDYDLMLRNVDDFIDFMQHGLGSEKLN
ncbi:MAG TPA: TetR/AcrR family transcriptional regulator [Anaerovoracaceae bacterium]|nr:TetR/AcrR family transcriptional regulator [Anaerovoracaceae bacterium]